VYCRGTHRQWRSLAAIDWRLWTTLAGLALPAVEKFLLLWVLSAALCFGLAKPLARRLPLVGRILVISRALSR